MRMFCILLLLLPLLSGCAVGRGPAGEIVLGVKAGALVETTEEGLHAVGQVAATLLPEPFGSIIGYGTPAILGALGVGAAARAKKQAEDRAWEESRTQQLADFAIKQGVKDA